MANEQLVAILLRDGVDMWNSLRPRESPIEPDLSGADLSRANLSEADLSEVNLSNADLSEADLSGADLRGANLSGANLNKANLRRARLSDADLSEADLNWIDFTGANLTRVRLIGADLSEAKLSESNLSGAHLSGANLISANLSSVNLTEAHLFRADLRETDLRGADLRGADLSDSDLSGAILHQANLRGADLSGADLREADFGGANLTRADLTGALCISTIFAHAILTDCHIYGIAAWDVNLDGAVQTNLRITSSVEPAITVDNLEVAQFLYLLLHNQKVRDVLDTIMSKVVLILGRFGEHKAILDALREALRNHPNGYISVLFDFDPQPDKPVLETVKTLANLARFVIADLTDPRMVRAELTAIIPNVPTVPVQPIAQRDVQLPTEYASWELYKSFLPIYRYTNLEDLLANLTASVIEPVEGHVQARRLSVLHDNTAL